MFTSDLISHIPVTVAKSSADLQGATKLILPGVGAFDHAMELLRQSGMRSTLDELVLVRAMPVLGVCVGMQILAATSEEGQLRGLGWIDGDVRRFGSAGVRQPLRLPHMGWNDVKPVGPSPLFAGLESEARFHFLHSYYFHCARSENILAQTDYTSHNTERLNVEQVKALLLKLDFIQDELRA